MPQRRRRSVSRLQRNQRGQNLRMTLFWMGATLGLVAVMIWAGVPLIVKAAAWLGDWQTSTASPVQEDTFPPSVPRLVINDSHVNEVAIDLRGFAEPGATVHLFVNGQKDREVLVENNGQFLASAVNLKKGENKIFALATDQSGNQSRESDVSTVVLDTEPPELSISEPADGSSFSGQENINVTVKGQAEVETRVWVQDRLARLADDGSFSLSIRLADGEQQIVVKGIDHAGNETEESVTVTYQP